MEKLRTVDWVYADISCATYPLANVDTISHDGSIDANSCLYIILNAVSSLNFGNIKYAFSFNLKIKYNKDSHEHVELLDDFLINLLNKKWTTFGRFR